MIAITVRVRIMLALHCLADLATAQTENDLGELYTATGAYDAEELEAKAKLTRQTP